MSQTVGCHIDFEGGCDKLERVNTAMAKYPHLQHQTNLALALFILASFTLPYSIIPTFQVSSLNHSGLQNKNHQVGMGRQASKNH